VTEAVFAAARSRGRRLVETPNANRWFALFEVGVVQTWLQWHDASDEIWTNLIRGASDDALVSRRGAQGQ